MKYSAVLLDLDGTALNTLDDLSDSVNHSLSQFGFPRKSAADVAAALGNGARRLMELLAPSGLDEAEFEKLLAFYKNYYDAHCRIKTAPYAGVTDMLIALRAAGIKTAIVSNKPDTAVNMLTQELFGTLLDASIGESPAMRRKPAPDMVLHAAKLLCVRAEDCLYVGDSEVDIETAKNAGMDCASVTWGFRSEAQLIAAGAESIVHTTEELTALVFESI